MSIFLTVLKILGIVLLSLIALVLVILLIVLFVPVRYAFIADINKEEDHYDLRLKVSWLLKLFRGAVWFKRTGTDDGEPPEDEGFGYEGKIFLFRIIPGKNEEEYKVAEDTLPYDMETPESVQNNEEDVTGEIKEAEGDPGDQQGSGEKEKAPEFKPYEDSIYEEDITEEEIPEKLRDKIKKFTGLLRSLPEKARRAGSNAGCKINGICDKIGELRDKAGHYYDVMTEASTERALSLIKSELLRILRALRPRKYRINLIYGFDDPAFTGEVTGVLSLLFLKAGKKAEFIPDFDNKVLEGDLYMKGRIMGITLLIVLWKLYFSKDFRRFYKRVRS